VASSPSARVGTVYGRASQITSLAKIQHCSRHHPYPGNQFYPLVAFERSGYLHPTFHDFINLHCTLGLPAPDPRAKLQLTFAVAYAITFTTAAFLKSASALLYPDHICTFVPLKPTPTPQRWAPELFHYWRTNSSTLFSAPHNVVTSQRPPHQTVPSHSDSNARDQGTPLTFGSLLCELKTFQVSHHQSFRIFTSEIQLIN
jgi:hypothetical protein